MNDRYAAILSGIKQYLKKNLPVFNAIAVIAVLIFVVMAIYYAQYAAYLKRSVISELSSIADLKVAEIVSWNEHQALSAKLLARDAGLADNVHRRLTSGQYPGVPKDGFLYLLNEIYGSEITVFSNTGKKVLSYPSDAVKVQYQEHAEYLQESFRSRKVVFAGFHLHGEKKTISFAYFFPVFGADSTASPLAVGLIRVNPSDYLYPLIQSWPTPSKTAETLLFRKDGDAVMFLNELRHRKNTALSLRIPLSQTNVIAVKTVLHGPGVYEGEDYNGAPVIGVTRQIPNTPWMMVSKVSTDEVMYPLRYFNKIMSVVVIAVIGISALILLLHWRRYTDKRLWNVNQELGVANMQLQATEQQLRAANQQLSAGNHQLRMALTDRKHALAELTVSEERFRSLFDNMAEGVALHDLVYEADKPVNYRIIDVNKRYMSMIGLSREQVAGKTATEAYRVPEPPYFDKYMQVALNKRPDFFESYFAPLGKHFAISVVPWHDKGFATIFMDITDHKRAEEALRESERKLSEAQKMAQLGHWEWDIKTGAVEWSDEVYRIFRLTKNFKPNIKSILALSPWPEDHARDTELIQHCQRSHERGSYEQRFMRPDKSIGYYFSTFQGKYDASGTLVSIVGTVQDITARKEIVDSLRTAHARLRRFLDSNIIGVLIGLPDGTIIEANDYYLNLIGYTREEFAHGKIDWRYLTPPEWIAADENAIKELRERGICSPYEKEYLLRDGTRVSVLLSDTLLPGPDEQIAGFAIDITDRKIAENALRESERKYRELAEDINDAIFSLDEKGVFRYVSPSVTVLTGYAPEELVGRQIFAFLRPDDRPLLARRFDESLIGSHEPVEFRYHAKNGTTRWGRISPKVILKEGKAQGMRGVFSDITFQKEMQEELLKAHKLDSIGILAGGIAHDFNNILTGIKGNLSVVRHEMPAGTAAGEMLAEAENAVLQAKNLTLQLLTFAKGGAPVKQSMALPELLTEAATFAARGSNARLSFIFGPNLHPIHADPGQLTQVIHNIVINAVQAMPAGGDITVAAANMDIDGREVPLSKGKYVRITLSDTGVGIPSENISRIFDPYFTTKKSGSGLGLAACYSIIRNHDGHISVSSEPGKGSTFTIYLPAHAGPAPAPAQQPAHELHKGRGRVLVLDDEPRICSVLKRMLAELGYEGECFSETGPMIERYRAAWGTADAFAVVILDLTIPGGQGGKEAIKALKEINPNIKAIVSSGYSNDPVVANYAEFGFSAILPKPFDIENISDVLHAVIERPAADNGGNA